MAGLLTGSGDVALSNSGAATSLTFACAIPTNTVVGDLLFAFLHSSNNSNGRTVSANSPGGGWTRLSSFRYAATTTNISGGLFFRVATAADIGANLTAAITTSLSRWSISIHRTSGFDSAALTAAGAIATVDTYAAAATSSAAVPAFATPSVAGVLLHTAALNYNTPTSDPFVTTPTAPAGDSLASSNSGYAASIASATSSMTAQRELAPGASAAGGSFGYSSPGVMQRAIGYAVFVPKAVPPAVSSSTAESASTFGSTARSAVRSSTGSEGSTGTGAVRKNGQRSTTTNQSATTTSNVARSNTRATTSVGSATVTGRTTRQGSRSTSTVSSATFAGQSTKPGTRSTSTTASSSLTTGRAARRSTASTTTAQSALQVGSRRSVGQFATTTVSTSTFDGQFNPDPGQATQDWTVTVTVGPDPWSVAIVVGSNFQISVYPDSFSIKETK